MKFEEFWSLVTRVSEIFFAQVDVIWWNWIGFCCIVWFFSTICANFWSVFPFHWTLWANFQLAYIHILFTWASVYVGAPNINAVYLLAYHISKTSHQLYITFKQPGMFGNIYNKTWTVLASSKLTSTINK